MEKEEKVLSKVPINKLYGVDDSGNLFVITPTEEFQVRRMDAEGVTLKESLTNLEIQGSIHTMYSIPDFGEILQESLDEMLDEQLNELTNIRTHILKGIN